MRAHEFITEAILREYRRDITGQKYGDKILKTLGDTYRTSDFKDDLYNSYLLINAARKVEQKDTQLINALNNTRQSKLVIFGNSITVTEENVRELLQQLKPIIVNGILDEIEGHDPTKNKEYSEWLTRIWINGGGQVGIEDLNRNDLVMAYATAKQKNILKPEDRDINKFKTLQQFEAMIKQYPVDDLLNIAFTGTGGYGNAKVFNDYPSATIVIPLDLDASRRAAGGMGEGSAEWCTKGEDNFDKYTAKGPLYILLPKKPAHEGEKYQLHFPTAQYMNEYDDPVSLIEVLTVRFPDLLPFFKQVMEQDGHEYTIFQSDEVLQPILDDVRKYVKVGVRELILDEKNSDEEYAIQRGYIDSRGNPDLERLENDNDLGAYLESKPDLEYFSEIALTDYIPKTVRELKEDLVSISKIIRYGRDEYDNSLQPMRYLPDALDAICKQKSEKFRDFDYGPKLAKWIEREIAWYKRQNGQWAATLPSYGSKYPR